MRCGWLLILAVSSPSFASEPCFYDKSLQLVICPGGTGGAGGDPEGPDFHRVPNELILSKPDQLVTPLTIPSGVRQKDQEIIRSYLETKRTNLESFRVWAEENVNSPSEFQKYEKSLDIYRSGIEQYRSSMSGLR